MPSISTIATVVPEFVCDREDQPDLAELWLADDETLQKKYQRIVKRAGVDTRYFVKPYSELVDLGGLSDRAALFEECGLPLLIAALTKLQAMQSISASECSHLISTSCTLPAIPALDVQALVPAGIPLDIHRVPLFQQGCAGGVVGLKLAMQLASCGSPTLLCSLELCSLVFQPQNLTGAQLVGAALFGDGVAATVVSPDNGELNLLGCGSVVLPGTSHLMGYDLFDDGFHLRLARTLPGELLKEVPGHLESFLGEQELSISDIDHWLFHPGGIKILDHLGEVLSLERSQCCWSYEVLKEVGNLSSATILFVIERFLRTAKRSAGEKVVILGIGPGLTLEFILGEVG